MIDKKRIEELRDFLGNELKVGDNVIINKNTRTGSSTIRKILKKATIKGFTKCQIITTSGRIYPNDVIKISDNQNQKAVEALERVKKDVWFPSDYKESIFEEIDQLIKEYGGKE